MPANNGEFKGATREAIRNLGEDITEIKDGIKDFSSKNEVEHKEMLLAITEIKYSKLSWKAWSVIGAAFVSSVGGIVIALLT